MIDRFLDLCISHPGVLVMAIIAVVLAIGGIGSAMEDRFRRTHRRMMIPYDLRADEAGGPMTYHEVRFEWVKIR